MCLREHPQMTVTFHPIRFSARHAAASRRLFRANLFCQKARLVRGSAARRQFVWPCQKQPWTKIASFAGRRITSGVPGSALQLKAARTPILRTSARTSLSGAVPVVPIDAISVLRAVGDTRARGRKNVRLTKGKRGGYRPPLFSISIGQSQLKAPPV
jgi:hypothetical protein